MQGLAQGHVDISSIIAALDLHWQRSLTKCDVLANMGGASGSANHQRLLGSVPKGMLKTGEPVCFLYLNSLIHSLIHSTSTHTYTLSQHVLDARNKT